MTLRTDIASPHASSTSNPASDLSHIITEVEARLPELTADFAAQLESWLAVARQGDAKADAHVHELKRLCYQSGHLEFLAAIGIDFPSYQTRQPLENNGFPAESLHPLFADGPTDNGANPVLWPLLGHRVAFPFGVPACPLMLNSQWVDFHARRGFNVLTFKTVRSREHPAHRYPHWVFLEDDSLGGASGVPPVVVGDVDTWPRDPQAFSMANSFGVGSLAPDGDAGWQADVAQSKAKLGPHQLLMVSVMGSHEVYSGADMVQDFARVATQAEAAGATVVELNLSCPNTVERGGGTMKQHLVCEDAASASEIVRAVRQALRKETKLVIKLAFMSEAKLRDLVVPLARDGQIDGVAGINTIPAQVQRADGSPTFIGTSYEPNTPRLTAGVSGDVVRAAGLQFVRWLDALRTEQSLTFDIIGMGGVMTASHVLDYLQAGAAAVQSASASWFSPRFALDIQGELEHLTPENVRSRAS